MVVDVELDAGSERQCCYDAAMINDSRVNRRAEQDLLFCSFYLWCKGGRLSDGARVKFDLVAGAEA